MPNDKSLEQLVENYTRQIREQRYKILDDFSKAYAANLAHLGKDFSLDDICLVEQEPHLRQGLITRRYWFEFKPKFDLENE
jgi:hypothetical protein